MNKQLNYRLLIVLAVALVFGAGAVFLLHSWQARRHARTLMAQVRQAEEASQPDRAVTYLQRYLVFAPQDNAARARCGELIEQLATSPHESWRAVTVYEEVLHREPARRDIRRRLAVLAVRLGWCAEGRQHLEVLLRDEPGQGDLESLLGQCQEEAGDYSAAVASYQNAIRHAPEGADAYVRLIALFRYRLDQPEKVGGVLDELVRNNGGSAAAYLARAEYRFNRGSTAESGRDVERALSLAPNDPSILLAAARLARRRGARDEALRCLRHGRECDPRDAALHLALAALELEGDRKAEAIECLRQGLRELPDQPDLLLLLAELLIERGEEVEALIRRAQRPGAPPGLAHYLTGRLQMKRRRWLEASRTLEEIVHSPEIAAALAGRTLLALARCHEQLGDGDRQLAALREAVARDATSSAARLALAAVLRDAGRIDDALGPCREAVRMPQAAEEGWLLLARLLMQRNRSLPAPKRHWAEVERVLDRAGRQPQLKVPVAVLRADVLAEQDRADEARALLEQTLADHPGDPELVTALAEQARRRGQPQSPPLSQARRTLHQLEGELSQLPADEQARLLRRMAATYLQLAEPSEGRRLCRLLAGRTPDDLASRLPLLDLTLQAGDEELLADLVADVRRLEGGEGTWWRYGEAARCLLLAQRGDLDALSRAKDLIAEVVRRRPDWTRGALLEAYVRELSGEAAEAAKAYLRAFHGGERRPGLAPRLVRLLAEQGRLDEADDVIRKFQQQAIPPAELARLGAEIALRQRRHDRARELARLAVSADSDDPEELIWLGQVLALAGRQSEAEDVLRRAVRLRGDLLETWIALVAHLVKSGHVSEAEVVGDDMRRCLPAEQRPLALAIGAEALGHLDNAESYYRQCLERTPNDFVVVQRAATFQLRLNHLGPAESLLRRLLAPEADVPAANRAWARRRLALLLAYEGGEEGYPRALALLDENARLKQDTLLDRRAGLLVRALDAEQRPEALRRLAELGKVQPFTAEELVCLVHLHESNGDADAAGERMLDLLALDRDNPEYLAQHIDRLLRRGRSDDARSWIVRLQNLEPSSSRVQAFRASVAKRKK